MNKEPTSPLARLIAEAKVLAGGQHQRAIKRQAQCTTALGLLEAAMMLVNRAATEAPSAGINGSCQIINKHIEVTQRMLLKKHDEVRL